PLQERLVMPVDEVTQDMDLTARHIRAHLDAGDEREGGMPFCRLERFRKAVHDVMVRHGKNADAIAIREVNQLRRCQAAVGERAVRVEVRQTSYQATSRSRRS